jgi:hypothetical protein
MQDWAEVISGAALKAIEPAKRKTGMPAKPPKNDGPPDLFDHDLAERQAPKREEK